ncbi:MAG: flagellar basal body P-ring formation protein FlgA [Planctomycetes bacterium]|nr:flagellar basal body P-ring formation protein FlgA [Planctomycetota bacterium]
MKQASPKRIPSLAQLARLAQFVLWVPVGLLVPVQGQGTESPSLKIFLPTQIKITNSLLRLGDIAVVRGDEALALRASQISLGRMFVPNQKVVLSRSTLLSRLASHGITGRQVTISGASKVTVQRDQKAISGQELTELAQTFLEESFDPPGKIKTQALRVPQFIYIDPKLKEVHFVRKLHPSSSPGYARVTITAMADGQPLATRDVSFRLEHETARIVAKGALARGAKLTPENTVIETHFSPRPQLPGWKPPYGKVLKRPLAAGMEITSALVMDPAPSMPPITLKANKLVIIRIKRPGFQVTVDGITESAGRTGDVIRVKNIDSQRIIHCTIKSDGTVEPLI